MPNTFNLMFAGVGGQGSLLIAELTSIAVTQEEYDVKQTEVHGVSQRGGSVETHVRFGEKIYSPIITPGEALAVIALEKLEALRFAHYVDRENGTILVNDFEMVPGSVAGAIEIYPHDAINHLREQGFRLVVIAASHKAKELGDGRMANVVMLGALSTLLPLKEESWQKALHVRLPKKYLDGNLQAFAAGQEFMQTEKVS